MADSPDVEGNPNPLPGDPELYQGPCRDTEKCFRCRQFGLFAIECNEKDTYVDKVQHMEERSPKYKDTPHLHCGKQEGE